MICLQERHRLLPIGTCNDQPVSPFDNIVVLNATYRAERAIFEYAAILTKVLYRPSYHLAGNQGTAG